jgi:probable HAF family extracellular repeat protein
LKKPSLKSAIGLTCALLLLSQYSAAQSTYSIVRLRAFGSTFTDAAAGINNVGQVAGNYLLKGQSHAYLWSNGVFKDLGPGSAKGLNNHGAVVGVSSATNRATLWRNGRTIDLGSLAPGDNSTALAINDNGLVAGLNTQISSGNTQAFQWTANSKMIRLPDFGGAHNQATGVNSQGTVVGWSEDASNNLLHHCLTWKNRILKEFFVPDTSQPTPTQLTLGNETIVNTFGPTLTLALDVKIAVAGATIRILPPFTNNIGTAISNKGTVVGYDFDSQGNSRAFVCLGSGQVFDLNTLIPTSAQAHWILQFAQGVNDNGQIVGLGKFNGVNSAFLLSPKTPIANPACF